MNEATEYQKYRVVLRRKLRPPVVPFRMVASMEVWGSEVRVGRWVEFDGDALREMYGNRWPDELQRVIEKDFYNVEGQDEKGATVPLSAWRREAGIRLDSGMRDGGSGRQKGSGIDTFVRHLRDVEGVKQYHDVVAVIAAAGVPAHMKVLEGWGKDEASRIDGAKMAYTRGRGPHSEACGLCAGGVPKRIRSAIDSVIDG